MSLIPYKISRSWGSGFGDNRGVRPTPSPWYKVWVPTGFVKEGLILKIIQAVAELLKYRPISLNSIKRTDSQTTL